MSLRSIIPTRTVTLVLVALVLLTVVTIPVAAAVEVGSLDAPSSAEPGESVTVETTADTDLGITVEMELRLIRMDTGEVLCSTTYWNPGSDSCSGSFEMPDEDVTIKAELKYAEAQTLDTQTTTITAEEPSNDDEGGLFDFSLDDFTDGMYEAFYEVLDTFMLGLFEDVMTVLLNVIPRLLTYTPDVAGNPAVEDMHEKTLIVAYATGTFGLAVIGLLYMTGPIIGISYQQVRPLLPRLLVAIVFATISLPLLQLAVDGTNALTTAFTPESFNFQQMSGMGAGLLLVLAINTALLVALAALFIIRDVYILFVAAISPLLAVLWVFPSARRYADTFIAGWFAALLMAPLDMLVFHFLIEMMEGTGGPEGVANWLYGIAGFILLLFIPYQLYGASQAGVGTAYLVAHGAVMRGSQLVGQLQGGSRREGSGRKIDDLDYLEQMEMRELQRRGGHAGDGAPRRSEAIDVPRSVSASGNGLTERQYDPATGNIDPADNKFHTEELEEMFQQKEEDQGQAPGRDELSSPTSEESASVDRQEELTHYDNAETEADDGNGESDTVDGDTR